MSKPELKVVDTPSPVTIAAVPIGLLTLVWPQCTELLSEVVRRANGEITLAGVYQRLMSGHDLLVTVVRDGEIIAANTLEVRAFDSGRKMLFLPCVSGRDMDDWVDQYMAVVISIAKDMGCSELRGMSIRKGWLRKLEQMGYNWFHVHEVVGMKLPEVEA